MQRRLFISSSATRKAAQRTDSGVCFKSDEEKCITTVIFIHLLIVPSSVGKAPVLQGSASQQVLCFQLILTGISLRSSESLTSAHWCKHGRFIHDRLIDSISVISKFLILIVTGFRTREKHLTIAGYFLRLLGLGSHSRCWRLRSYTGFLCVLNSWIICLLIS